MENNSTFTGILENINKNLKPNGLFIGCCFDGQLIFDDLQGRNNMKGENENNIIWKIDKKYYSTEFLNTSDSLGLAIEVYMSSIDKTHTEYLVNFEYLKDYLNSRYNIVPLGREKSQELGFPDCYNNATGLIKFSDLREELLDKPYELDGPDGASKDLSYIRKQLTKMTRAEQEISNYNVAFAFYKKD